GGQRGDAPVELGEGGAELAGRALKLGERGRIGGRPRRELLLERRDPLAEILDRGALPLHGFAQRGERVIPDRRVLAGRGWRRRPPIGRVLIDALTKLGKTLLHAGEAPVERRIRLGGRRGVLL